MDEQLFKIYERLPAFDLCMVQVDAARQPQAVQDRRVLVHHGLHCASRLRRNAL